MSIGKFAIGEAAVGQIDPPTTIRSKLALRRPYVALADARAIPEPR